MRVKSGGVWCVGVVSILNWGVLVVGSPVHSNTFVLKETSVLIWGAVGGKRRIKRGGLCCVGIISVVICGVKVVRSEVR